MGIDSKDLQKRLSQVPRVNLAFLPTPLSPLNNLTKALGSPVNLWIKRDDLTGLALGGNKARKLEYILGDAVAKGADAVVTSAASHSNMLRMTSAAARQLGMEIYLVMRGKGNEPVQGNLLLDYVFGANITYIDTLDPYSQFSVDVMNKITNDLIAKGKKPYTIDMRYNSGGLATIGYVNAATELVEQIDQQKIEDPMIICATGSGTTQAGLQLGFHLMGRNYKVQGISAQQSADKMKPRIIAKIKEAADILGEQSSVPESEIFVDDRWIGPSYGVSTSEGMEAIRMMGRYEGILLDPCYSGKSFSGLLGELKEGHLNHRNVIFIHTGGAPILFSDANEVALAMRVKDIEVLHEAKISK